MTVFDRIYARNVWNGRVSLSGPGSDPNATKMLAGVLSALASELEIESFVNAGCGDDLWTPALPGYVGIDGVGLAIARARRRHPERTYLVGDIRESVPRGNLVLLRDVVQHLPLEDGVRILSRIRESGSSWLLASTYSGPSPRHPGRVNADVAPGDYYCPDLTAPPFDLPEPERVYPDGFDYDDPTRIADPSKWLGLWRLASAS